MSDMDIFIGNLPGKKFEAEILQLLKQVDKNIKAQIKTPILKNVKDGFFCIASISQEKLARRFIKKYNLKSPYGQPLHIREYIHRSYGNERRDIHWREKEWDGTEKRSGERRAFVAQTSI